MVTLCSIDVIETTLYQLALQVDPSAVIRDLPLYPIVWVYCRDTVDGMLALYLLSVFFRRRAAPPARAARAAPARVTAVTPAPKRHFCMCMSTSAAAHAARSFMTLISGGTKAITIKLGAFLIVTGCSILVVITETDVRTDNSTAFWQLVSMAAVNSYVVVMGLAFEPSAAARDAFSMCEAKRQQAIALIETIATKNEPSALYSPELLVKTVVKPKNEKLTLEQQEIIGTALRCNPATYRSLDDEEEKDEEEAADAALGRRDDLLTPKLNADEEVLPGHLITLIRGRATRHPDMTSSTGLFMGDWYAVGAPPTSISVEKLLSVEDGLEPKNLVTCISEGFTELLLSVDGPFSSGTRVVVMTGSDGALIAAVDQVVQGENIVLEGINSLLAQTVGYTEASLSEEEFKSLSRPSPAALPTLMMKVRVVGKYHDPFEEEEELRYPFVVRRQTRSPLAGIARHSF